MAYATVEELTAHLGSEPADAQLLLDRASRQIDQVLLCQVYDTADADVIAALKLATLEQVAAGLEHGDTTGLGGSKPSSFTLGRLSVQRQTSGVGEARKIGPLWEQAWAVLQQAGLTGHGPQTP